MWGLAHVARFVCRLRADLACLVDSIGLDVFEQQTSVPSHRRARHCMQCSLACPFACLNLHASLTPFQSHLTFSGTSHSFSDCHPTLQEDPPSRAKDDALEGDPAGPSRFHGVFCVPIHNMPAMHTC